MVPILRSIVVMTVTIFLAHSALAAKVQYSAIVVNAATGHVLHSDDADALTYPASLTKMMTLYLMFDAIKKKRISFQTQFRTSVHATTQAPSKLGLKVGESISAYDAMLALIVKSANDVAVTVAETLGGNEHNFAEMMTHKARTLGMQNTTFKNSSGLPHKQQKTTARDMVILGLALHKDFPEFYKYFKTTMFQFRGSTYKSHNKLVKKFQGCDGIKTGFINASGFNLVSSAIRNGQRYIVAVLGGDTAHARDQQSAQLLELAFDEPCKNQQLATLNANVLHARTDVSHKYHQLHSLDTLAANIDKDTELFDSTKPIIDKFDKLKIVKTNMQSVKNRAGVHRLEPTIVLLNSTSFLKNRKSAWSIQIGSYASSDAATAALTQCRKKLKHAFRLKDLVTLLPVTKRTKKNQFRACLSGFNAVQAKQACRVLQKFNQKCLVINPQDKPKMYAAIN